MTKTHNNVEKMNSRKKTPPLNAHCTPPDHTQGHIVCQDLNLIGSYLARRDVEDLSLEALGTQVDLLVLLGSSLTGPLEIVATALSEGAAKRILISGGLGHSTQGLIDNLAVHPRFSKVTTCHKSEAEIYREILISVYGIDPNIMLIESRSTNCGSNAVESRQVLEELDFHPDRVILIQDPTMQRRSHASFERAWQNSPPVEFISFAPFIPTVISMPGGDYCVIGDIDNVWSFERYVALVLGEIDRLNDNQSGYGPRGRNFIDHIDIPDIVIDAHERSKMLFAGRNPG